MFENPRRGRQARSFTTNVPKILDLKSSSEQIFPKIDVGCPQLNFNEFLSVGDSYDAIPYLRLPECTAASILRHGE